MARLGEAAAAQEREVGERDEKLAYYEEELEKMAQRMAFFMGKVGGA